MREEREEGQQVRSALACACLCVHARPIETARSQHTMRDVVLLFLLVVLAAHPCAAQSTLTTIVQAIQDEIMALGIGTANSSASARVHAASTDYRLPFADHPKTARQLAVIDAFQWAWQGYRRCAWGQDELMPLSCAGTCV